MVHKANQIRNLKRLYVFTGKAGVGKTTTSLAFAKYLKNSGKKVLFMDFEGEDKKELCHDLGLDYKRLDLFQSLEIYIGLKLNSQIVAAWITSSEFFRSIVEIVPGMSYLIYLGHIMDMIKKDKDLTIVLDSPSSGHATMMLQSAYHYRDLFKSGLLFADIQKMLQFAQDNDIVRINICTIPTELAMTETQELKNEIQSMNFETKVFLNNSFTKLLEDENCQDLGPLTSRIKLEKSILEENKSLPLVSLSLMHHEQDLVKELSKDMGELV